MPQLFVAQFHMTDGRVIRSIILETEESTPTLVRNGVDPDSQFELVALEDQIHGIMNPIVLDGAEVAILATKRITQQEFLEIMVSQKGRL